ncbi:hypothetical protein Ac2012v2_000528 [Leucoagaricus gongylophorus]
MFPFQPTLRYFIIRQEVIHLYRHAVRSSKVIEDPVTRRETLAWIRSEFERNKHIPDAVSYLVVHLVMKKALNYSRRLSRITFEPQGAHYALSFKISGNPEPYTLS